MVSYVGAEIRGLQWQMQEAVRAELVKGGAHGEVNKPTLQGDSLTETWNVARRGSP